MTLWAHAKSVASISWITASLTFWAILLVIVGLAKLAAPSLGPRADRLMDRMYRAAVAIDDFWLRSVIGIRWERPALELDRSRTYVVLANHSSWADILVLQSVLVRDGPVLKFLAKRSLVFVPIFGVVFWAFDFPMLRRRSREGEDDAARRQGDLEAVRAACRVVRERPAALMNFAEGTRFSEQKRDSRQSPYRNLLRPRTGGLAALLDALGEDVEAVLDVTLVYPGTTSFWAFLSGAIEEVDVVVDRIERADVPTSREELGAWLAERWQGKDERIEELHRLP